MDILEIKDMSEDVQRYSEIYRNYCVASNLTSTVINGEEVQLCQLPYNTAEDKAIVNEAKNKLRQLYTQRIMSVIENLSKKTGKPYMFVKSVTENITDKLLICWEYDVDTCKNTLCLSYTGTTNVLDNWIVAIQNAVLDGVIPSTAFSGQNDYVQSDNEDTVTLSWRG